MRRKRRNYVYYTQSDISVARASPSLIRSLTARSSLSAHSPSSIPLASFPSSLDLTTRAEANVPMVLLPAFLTTIPRNGNWFFLSLAPS